MLAALFCGQCSYAQQLFAVEKGSISFTSEAPLELIKARSEALRGVFNIGESTCAFTIMISDFQGFNNPLQQIHFNENYMESPLFPEASFTGKLIENIDLATAGSYEIRVKGDLNIHGVKRERIIKGKIDITETGMQIRCTFHVALQDHDIRIPKVVQQKIAESIEVILTATLRPRQ